MMGFFFLFVYGSAFRCISITASNDKYFVNSIYVIESFNQRVLPELVVIVFSELYQATFY